MQGLQNLELEKYNYKKLFQISHAHARTKMASNIIPTTELLSLNGMSFADVNPFPFYTNVQNNQLYFEINSIDQLKRVILDYERAKDICNSNVIQLVGWGTLTIAEYQAFMAANNNNQTGVNNTEIYIVVVTPSTGQPPNYSSTATLFQAVFTLFALNASNGFGIAEMYADSANVRRPMHYAIKTANPSVDEYDLFTINDATETVWVVPQTSKRESAATSAKQRIASNMGVPFQQLQSELSDPLLRFGGDDNYGMDNALFHPTFASYYQGKRTIGSLPYGITIFKGGHLPDWTINTDNAYKQAQTNKIAVLEAFVNNATKATKSTEELFDELKPTIAALVALYGDQNMSKSDSAFVNTNANVKTFGVPTLVAAYKQLITSYGTTYAVPGLDNVNIKWFTNGDGMLYDVNDTDVAKGIRFYYSGTAKYSPEGLDNAVAILLNLIARVATTNTFINVIDVDLLESLAIATNYNLGDATVPQFVVEIAALLQTPEERLQQAIDEKYALFDTANKTFKDDTGKELVRPSITTQSDVDNFDLKRVVSNGYIAYRKELLEDLTKQYDAAIAKLTVTPLVEKVDFDNLVETCENDPIQQDKAGILNSQSYKDVVEAVRLVTEQLNAPPVTPPTGPPIIDLEEFKENASPAVQKAIAELGGRKPTDLDIARIETVGKRTPYNSLFVVNSDDYVSFMQGYGPIVNTSIAKIATDPKATPLEIAGAQMLLAAESGSLSASAKRKALAFSQTIL